MEAALFRQPPNGELLLLEHRLRLAIAENAFQLCYQPYQPLFTIEGMEIAGFEALLRWTDPELGPISPTRFIPIAEHTGLIEELGDWVMREVCAQLARWAAAGLKTVPVAINISPLQLLRGSLIERVEGYLRQFQLSPSELHMEITESVLMDMPIRLPAALTNDARNDAQDLQLFMA